MRETLLLLVVVTALTAFTLRPMLAASRGGEGAAVPAAKAPDGLDEAEGGGLLAATLASHLPGHARLRAEAAAGDRAKW